MLEPLADAIGRHVLAGRAIFADDAPVAMLAPGTGKTQTARLWAYGRDERPWGSAIPPASLAIALGPCMDGSCMARGLFGFGIWSVAAIYTASRMRQGCRAP